MQLQLMAFDDKPWRSQPSDTSLRVHLFCNLVCACSAVLCDPGHDANRPAELAFRVGASVSVWCARSCLCVMECACFLAEERQSPELYASNVRKVMGDALGAELSNHGIPQQQALKRNGIYVDWTGR